MQQQHLTNTDNCKIRRLTTVVLLLAGISLCNNSIAQTNTDLLDQYINEVDLLISTDDIDGARKKLAEAVALNIRDERLDVLSSRLRLFDDLESNEAVATESTQAVSTLQATQLTEKDKLIATDLFDSLKIALENGESSQVHELSATKERTQTLLKALFENYSDVKVDISETITDESTQSFFAQLDFLQMKTNSGDVAYPAQAWKSHELRVTKSFGNWQLVRW